MIERSINFERGRWMRCGVCGHEWQVVTDWLDRFDQGVATCPTCDTDCRSEDRPDFWADPEDPMHNASALRDVYWYHSSTLENWPDSNFDPAAGLTEETKRRIEAMGSGVERWAESQKAKALHVGTYEAAVESMFRRMRDQAGSFHQFYLYRIQLDPNCLIEPGVHKEPTNWMGDAYLADVSSPGTNVLRYVNVHEDPSSVSLAIEPSAVRAVQRILIPLTVDLSDPWILSATQRLLAAASQPRAEVKANERKPRRVASPLFSEARLLESEIAAMLPSNLGNRLDVGFAEEAFVAAPERFPAKLVGVARLVLNPPATLEALDVQPWRLLSSLGSTST